MGGSTRTFSPNSRQTDAFQNMLYQGILNVRQPGNTPDYSNQGASFNPSSVGRRMGGSVAYRPFVGRSPQDEYGRPLNDPLGFPIDYTKVPGSPEYTPWKPLPAPRTPGTLGAPGSASGGNVGNEGARLFSGVLRSGQAQRRSGPPTTLPGDPGLIIPNTGGYTAGPNDPLRTNPDGSPRTAVPRDSAAAGGIQGIIDLMQQIFAVSPSTAGLGVGIPDLPTYDTASADAASMDAANINVDPRYGQIIDQIMQSAGGAGRGLISRGASGNGTDITAPTISREGTTTQSADEIVRSIMGGNSMFTNNILPAYNDLFNTQNALAAATAKEQAGNLTGSGFANSLGSALNRNTSSQQALLADVLNNLVSQEIGRQGAGAQLATGMNTEEARMNLQGQTTSAQLRQQAEALRVQAEASGRSDLMAAANSMQQQAIQQAALEQQANLTNAGMQQQTALANAGWENTANSEYFQAGVNRNQQQAQLDQQRQLAQFAAANGMSIQNAQQIMDLIRMLFGQTGGFNTQTSGGAGAALPGIAQILTAFM